MTFRVYSGPKGAPDLSPTDKEKMLFKQFNTLDEALAWARHIDLSGRVALHIDSDDGSTGMNRREIGAALAAGNREQVGG
jgi:hypothetical protein